MRALGIHEVMGGIFPSSTDTELLLFAGLAMVLGLILVSNGRSARRRYHTIQEVAAGAASREDHAGDGTVRGAMQVTEAATPERPPPLNVITDDRPPGLWAWRVRQKVRRGGGNGPNTRWQTVESGLSVGTFAVMDDDTRVEVETHSLVEATDGDPFDSATLFLGEPEVDESLGEPDPFTRFLHRLGVGKGDGPLGDLEVTVSIGSWTTTPDRYQATVLREGDEVIVHGAWADTPGGRMLRGSADDPLVIATGDLDAKADALRSRGRWRLGMGLVAVAIALIVAGLGLF